jgi:hypothetical protein
VQPTYTAFTIKFKGKTDRIIIPIGFTPFFDPIQNPDKSPFPIIQKRALWDTGATGSLINSQLAHELNLTPVGSRTLIHDGGQDLRNTYIVNIFLPNHVAIWGALVAESGNIVGNFDAIIGMDIITMGDMALTNCNGESCMSFRIPSIAQVDYVEDFKKSLKSISPPMGNISSFTPNSQITTE